ncbi:MAG: metal ABC transporter permease [Tepidisphaerales bacterium]
MTAEELLRVVLLQDHNTRVVVLGTALLGAAAGVVGTFTLLRRRALMGDALAHATLPGVALAFIVALGLGWETRSVAVLLAGAAVTGAMGLATMHLLERLTRLKQDAAMGIVLSVYYGAGVALLAVAQRLPGGSAAGLEGLIYGKTASMLTQDAQLIAAAAGLAVLVTVLLFKELALLSFDPGYAAARGYPVTLLDAVMLLLVMAVTVIGLQAVGLILVIALLIIPPAAARFWTHHLGTMTVLAGGLGAAAAVTGAVTSAVVEKLPSGATIVLSAAAVFFFSMLFGTARGLLPRFLEQRRLQQRQARRHLLRALYEASEARGGADVPVSELARWRAWRAGELRRALRWAEAEGLVRPGGHVQAAGGADGGRESGSGGGAAWGLTADGHLEAARLVREHRLWELFLLRYADIAPSQVDRDADAIEHAISPAMLAELEQLLEAERHGMPPSPHPCDPNAVPAGAGAGAAGASPGRPGGGAS